jgi:hypothetical protein
VASKVASPAFKRHCGRPAMPDALNKIEGRLLKRNPSRRPQREFGEAWMKIWRRNKDVQES